MLATTARAQDFERYRPNLPGGRSSEPELPSSQRDAYGSREILVPELKALIFVEHESQVLPGQSDIRGVMVDSQGGLYLLDTPEFQSSVASLYLGGAVSIYNLNALARDIVEFYRYNDMPIVDVSIPEQDITDGVVQVVVTEGRVGTVYVESTYFDPNMLGCCIEIGRGDLIYESWIRDDLRRLSRDPFRTVDVEFAPGGTMGTTDITYRVQDQLPWRFYAGYEDTGNRNTGIERTVYGVNWGNAFGKDHDASYQLTGSSDFHSLRAHSGVYSIPLWCRDTLVFFGSYADIASRDPAITNTGRAWQASVRYNMELPEWYCNYTHQLVFGFDRKQTNTNLEFGGATVLASNVAASQFVMGYNGQRQLNNGYLAFGVELVGSPGHWGGHNNDVAFATLRAGADSTYGYVTTNLDHLFYLPNGWEVSTRFNAQLAEGNLLPSEQMGFGGYHSVRGYDMRLVNGDSGWRTNLELRSCPIEHLCRTNDRFQYHFFYDHGEAKNHSVLVGGDPSVNVASVGVGLRYSWSPHATFRFDYGAPLKRSGVAAVDIDDRVHIGAVIAH